jgi:hypothetical protein
VRKEREILEDQAHRPALDRHEDAGGRVEPDVLAARDPARLRPFETGERTQQRRLPGSGEARDGERPTGLCAQLDRDRELAARDRDRGYER